MGEEEAIAASECSRADMASSGCSRMKVSSRVSIAMTPASKGAPVPILAWMNETILLYSCSEASASAVLPSVMVRSARAPLLDQ